MKKILLTMLFAFLLVVVVPFDSYAKMDKETNILLSVPISESSEEKLHYYQSYDGNSGPMDFAIVNDSEFFILDNIAHRVVHFENSRLTSVIELEKQSDPLALLFHDERLYVLDRENISVFLVNGQQESKITLPEVQWDVSTVVPFGLLVNDMIWEDESLILITEVLGNYSLNDSGSFVKTEKGYSAFRRDENIFVMTDTEQIEIKAQDLNLQFLGKNDNGLFVFSCFESAPNATNDSFGSIRAYDQSGKVVWKFNLYTDEWNHFPTHFARLYNGNVYVMSPYADTVEITINEIGDSLLSNHLNHPSVNHLMEPDDSVRDAHSVQSVSLSRTQVKSRAEAMINYSWTFYPGHDEWTYWGAYMPFSFVDMSYGDTFTGIPYCWAMYNGYSNVTDDGGVYHQRFATAVIKKDPSNPLRRYYTTGNVRTNVPYGMQNTIGLDCSGYVSSCYGFTNKVPTANFYSAGSSYFITIAWTNLQSMDCIVASGSHIILYVYTTNSATNTYLVYESNTNQGKTVSMTRTKASLEANQYIPRRPASW